MIITEHINQNKGSEYHQNLSEQKNFSMVEEKIYKNEMEDIKKEYERVKEGKPPELPFLANEDDEVKDIETLTNE